MKSNKAHSAGSSSHDDFIEPEYNAFVSGRVEHVVRLHLSNIRTENHGRWLNPASSNRRPPADRVSRCRLGGWQLL